MCRISHHLILLFLASLFLSSHSMPFDEFESHQNERTYTRLAKLVTDFSDEYHAFNVFIARRDPSNDLLVSRALKTLMRRLSQKNVFSIITQISDIPSIITYSAKNLGRPVFVVIIRSMLDLRTFANVTQTSNLNLYRTLVIFTKNMRYCNKPEGNLLQLTFDMKMWVVCQNHPIIREWYSLEPNKIETFDLFVWKEDVPGMRRLTNMSFYERRSSLKGKSLRVTIMEHAKLEGGRLTGFFGSVLTELAALANFTIDLQPYEEAPGSYDPEKGSYNGIMGKLDRRTTDIGLGELTITEERLDVCDFSKPMLVTKSNFYIRKPQEYHLMWAMYYYAFGIRASYCLLLFLVVSPIFLALMMYRDNISFSMKLYENYLNVWGIFCSKSPSDFPEEWPARIAYYSLYVLSFMLYSAYSALLVSYLANYDPDLPFKSLEEFTKAHSHRITTIKNTSYIDTFRVSDDMSMRKLNSFLLADKDLATTLTAAVDQACDKEQRLVLYMDDVILNRRTNNLTCELIPFERGRFGSMALAFVKDSPYVGLINFHLQRLRAVGLLNVIKDRNVKKPEVIPVVYKPVDFYSTLPAFVILYFGMFISIFLILFENIIDFCSRGHSLSTIALKVCLNINEKITNIINKIEAKSSPR